MKPEDLSNVLRQTAVQAQVVGVMRLQLAAQLFVSLMRDEPDEPGPLTAESDDYVADVARCALREAEIFYREAAKA